MFGSGANRKAELEKYIAGGQLGERKESSLHYIMSCVVDIRARFPQLTLALGRSSTQVGSSSPFMRILRVVTDGVDVAVRDATTQVGGQVVQVFGLAGVDVAGDVD